MTPRFQFPLPFWFYILPMLATTFGWLPAAHPFYSFASGQLLPICLVLLLIGTNLKEIYRLGAQAITLMLCGAAGTMLGGIASFKLYERWLPEGSWASVGALAASWTGGSANLVAVKEALGASDSLIAPIILVDAALAYSWMALLLWASAWQSQWNHMIIPDGTPARGAHPGIVRTSQRVVLTLCSPAPLPKKLLADPAARAAQVPLVGFPFTGASITGITIALAIGILLSLLAQWVAAGLPTFGGTMSPATWTILLVTTAGLALSLTSLRSLEHAGASKIGTALLYLILATIGARSNFQAIVQAPIFLALGITWILIHGICLLAAGFLLKAPLGMIATASQANIGGTISAPIVGATYHPQLASVGLLMAILGNILGTYLGLLTAFFLRS